MINSDDDYMCAHLLEFIRNSLKISFSLSYYIEYYINNIQEKTYSCESLEFLISRMRTIYIYIYICIYICILEIYFMFYIY